MTVVYIYNLDSGDDPVSKLGVGEYTFGRGDLLKCNDRRISRNHGIINIKEDSSVTITSIHQNPCFYQSINNSTITILPKDSPITVTDGDKFALLPDQFWFRVKFQHGDNDIETHSVPIKDESIEGSCNNHIVPLKRDIQDEPGPSNVKKLKFDEDSPNNQNDTKKSQNEQFTSFMLNNAELRAVLFSSDEDEQNDESEKPVKNMDETQEAVNKTTQSSDTPNISNTETKKQRRDRCWYGSSCYRKNSAHLLKYSHPGNSDYESDPNDDRPMCAFKASCYRRNKEHRQAYKHPSARNSKNTNTIMMNKKRTDRINYDESSEDDCLFVDSGSEYEVNSVTNDETDTDLDEFEEEKEETNRLVKEAKRFTKKKNED